MRRESLSDTTGRRTARLRSRRRSGRKSAGVAALVVCLLLGGAAGVFAVYSAGRIAAPERPETGRSDVVATATTPTPAATLATETVVASAPSEPPTITVAGVGDMLFDRNVKRLIEKQGGEAPLARVAERLAAADITVGNLETTLATSGSRNPVKEAKYAFRGHPKGIKGLSLAGFDAVSLANNHALDYGWEPLRDTIASLDDAGIGHAGAGADTDSAWEPATMTTPEGATVAYLAFSHIVPPGFLASDDRPGVASGKMDMGLVKDAVRAAKRTHDYVIVSFHWGVEYVDDANADQVRKAHQAIDAGADMVLAHHPHVIQGVEFYKGRLIAYSLGDFVFDHYSRKTGEAFILEAELGPDGTTEATAVPVYLDEFGRPEFVSGEHATEILSRLRKISSKHGTSLAIRGSKGRLTP